MNDEKTLHQLKNLVTHFQNQIYVIDSILPKLTIESLYKICELVKSELKETTKLSKEKGEKLKLIKVNEFEITDEHIGSEATKKESENWKKKLKKAHKKYNEKTSEAILKRIKAKKSIEFLEDYHPGYKKFTYTKLLNIIRKNIKVFQLHNI